MKNKFLYSSLLCGLSTLATAAEWKVESQQDWLNNKASAKGVEIKDGVANPTEKEAFYQSKIQKLDGSQKLKEIRFDQSPVWQNWQPVENLGPSNLGDAPVFLSVGPNDHWAFGRYNGASKSKPKKGKQTSKEKKTPSKPFEAKEVKLDGYDEVLLSTPFPNQYNAPSGTGATLGGYHAWHSRDMKNWVHYGPITEGFSRWMTTAEYVDGKFYFYYDFPNDQDPHLYIDNNLKDGKPGDNKGLAFKDPSDGSDCTFFRDKDGKFHVIYEDWSPIDANKRSWDSPLAGHAVSTSGYSDFTILPPAVDYRTKPTGKFAEYAHPHWHKEDPENFPAKVVESSDPKKKKGGSRAYARYEIHEPRQEAYGDWASIKIGGQYYLFGDYDPADTHKMSTIWFTSDSLDKPFKKCDHIGEGHPDPDVGFADGKFYLFTQQKTDYTSAGPWVETVTARVGVDSSGDGKIDTWTDWTEIKESYAYAEGFAKHVNKTAAAIDLSKLPEAHAFQFEFKMVDTTENKSKPMMDKVILKY